ncbi:MAG: DUF3618 domain-containing protein [Solirubrobacterales bacterium]
MADEPEARDKSKPYEPPRPEKDIKFNTGPPLEFEKDQPFMPDGIGPDAPAARPNPNAPVEGTPAPPAGAPGSPYSPPPPKRTSAQIRADIENQRQKLGENVDHLRDRVTELTDWKSQLVKHRKKIVVGAVATGFVVGGLMALRRR